MEWAVFGVFWLLQAAPFFCKFLQIKAAQDQRRAVNRFRTLRNGGQFVLLGVIPVGPDGFPLRPRCRGRPAQKVNWKKEGF